MHRSVHLPHTSKAAWKTHALLHAYPLYSERSRNGSRSGGPHFDLEVTWAHLTVTENVLCTFDLSTAVATSHYSIDVSLAVSFIQSHECWRNSSPQNENCWKCAHPQVIQDVDEFVSSSDLEKCSIASLTPQWILCSEWVHQNESPNSW